MDSILVVGSQDQKLGIFLKRLGYNVVPTDEHSPVTDVIVSSDYDLILVDSRTNKNAVEYCQFLRGNDSTKLVPVLCISESPAERYELKELQLNKVELVDSPYSIGNLAARIATQIRLLKFAGADARTATLSAMNASLRELNMRFGKELEDARNIQQSLLPQKLPTDPRYSIAASYQPLDEVGGDWYNVQCNESGKITVQIADVTGHGISAALIGSMTKLAMAAANKELPEELLREMNRLISPQLPEGRFVTVASYLYSPVDGALDCARAGHPPLMVFRKATGKVENIDADGFPLGFLDDAEYTRGSTKLEIGDLALLLTDGLPEAQNRQKEFYGFDRIGLALQGVAQEVEASSAIRVILADFKKFMDGRRLKDDVTLVALRRLS